MAIAGKTLQDVAVDDNHIGAAAAAGGIVEANGVGPAQEEEVRESVEDAEDHEGLNGTPWDARTEPDSEKRPERPAVMSRISSAAPPYSVFSKRKKNYIVFMASFAGFFSPLSAAIYFPALNPIATELGVSSGLINLTITSYMIFQGLAPTFMGDLADASGRRPAYIIGFIIYVGACIGIALQDSFAALFILRCIQSTGSSGTIALGNGVVADVSTSAERGTYMGWATGGMLIAPAVGPIIGGILSQYLGWRSIFWFLLILVGLFLIPFVLTFPETGRNVVGNGSIPPQGWNMSLLNYLALRKVEKENSNDLERTESRQSAKSARKALAKRRKFRFPNPLKTLAVCLEKDMFVILISNSIIYVAFMDVNASLPYLFQRIYGYDELRVGLSYIPFGVGCFLASVINGKILDWRFKKIAKKLGIAIDKKRATDLLDFPLERARIPVALILTGIGVAALVAYGWALDYEVNVGVPLFLLFVMGYCLNGGFGVINVMLVDYYPQKPATATAANNLFRCTMGAGATAVIVYMLDAMGTGWCFTFIALVVVLFMSLLWMMMHLGPKWRREKHERQTKHDEEKRRRQEHEDGHEKGTAHTPRS